MLVSRMHQEFKVGVDKTDSLNSADLLPEEIDVYLSDAQEQFIEQRAYGNNPKGLSVEETQKRVSDLQSITLNAVITPAANATDNKTNGVFVDLPTDYRHALHEEALITYTDCNGTESTKLVPVEAITHQRYNKIIQNPFLKPSTDRVLRLPYGRFNSVEHFELISGDGVTVTTYYLRYLKNPEKIDLAQALTPPGLDSTDHGELKDECYREIIRIAVRNALGDIESPRVQESIQRNTEIE